MASHDRGASGGREEKTRENVIDLSKFLEKRVHVKFQGGREVSGVLKGFDMLLNLVLDECTEYQHVFDPEDVTKIIEQPRQLGLLLCRGPAITVICPADSFEAIPNPFVQAE